MITKINLFSTIKLPSIVLYQPYHAGSETCLPGAKVSVHHHRPRQYRSARGFLAGIPGHFKVTINYCTCLQACVGSITPNMYINIRAMHMLLWQVESDHNFAITLDFLAGFAHDLPTAGEVKAGQGDVGHDFSWHLPLSLHYIHAYQNSNT